MAVRIQIRRGSAEEWATKNPVLAEGELALESDTSYYKIGDGVSAWNSLPYGGIRGLQGIQGGTGIKPDRFVADVNQSYPGGGPNDPQGYLDYYFPSAVPGDSVVDTETSDLYIKSSDNEWINVGGVAGVQGEQGPIGLQGFTGLQGDRGFTGIQGAQGIQGGIGPQGVQGFQGLQGITGNQGIQGLQGSQGPQGLQGVQGLLGETGSQGTQGISGLIGIGIQGPQGIQGEGGNQGIQGLQGVFGNTGLQGAQGIQGSLGFQGVQGLQGIQGAQGIQGLLGVQGIQGISGVTGNVGIQGTQGIQGLLGFQGVQGTSGANGDAGIQGVQGIQGLLGFQGVQGISGITGNVGIQGVQGIQGLLGFQGVQGISGVIGDVGIQGSQGIQGLQGVQGIQGISGVIGDVGIQGSQGIQGLLGFQGIQGLQGISGVIGNTGLQGMQGTQGLQGIQGSSGNPADISIGLNLPTSLFDVTGSPTTGSGTFTVTFTDQVAGGVFAGPASGAAAPPSFRTLTAGDVNLGTTSTPQFAGIGLGTPAVSGWDATINGAICEVRSTVTAVSNVYTLDVQAANEFITAATISAATTINLSNLDTLPSGYLWRGVFSFQYSSGTVTWFTGNSGYTVKWDGGTAPTLTASERETLVITVVGGQTTIEVAPLRGRV